METGKAKKRIVILGGGFGGVATDRHLEGLALFSRPDSVRIGLDRETARRFGEVILADVTA